jgi:hypothetical protein
MKERIEIIDGREYKVTTLPSDPRLQPARTKKRQLWNSLSAKQKKRYLAEKRAAARKKRKRRRRNA